MANNGETAQFFVGDCIDVLEEMKPSSVNLLITSPPYDIGKSYEKSKTDRGSLTEYVGYMTRVIERLATVVTNDGAVCWQVGNRVEDGCIEPIDMALHPAFRSNGFHLKNRVVWRQSHGLHLQDRLSGRYEVMLWYVRDPRRHTFNLDDVRVPSEEPGKKSYKGKKAGQYSGNPLGKNPGDFWEIMRSEWDLQAWDFPNVKNGHREKTAQHPCQYPIELAERCVLAFSKPGDTVLDPFCGVGTTAVAASFHGRCSINVDSNPEFVEAAKQRLALKKEDIPRRPMTERSKPSKAGSSRRTYPEEWMPVLEEHLKKPRLCPKGFSDYGATEVKKASK